MLPSSLQSHHPDLYIGLMSGTSLDGVDGVLAQWSDSEHIQVKAHVSLPFSQSLRQELLALNTCGFNELHRAALAGNEVSRVYAQVVNELLRITGATAKQVCAIGAHGQTVRHQPQMHDGTGYTLQIQNPALLAELTGIAVIADLRSRDIAAGGQGAPLVPAFHLGMFGREAHPTLVLNIGGISNLSVLPALLDTQNAVLGFDCGPGNALLDAWCLQHTGRTYDDQGSWAAGGQVINELLELMLEEPFLKQPPPKSTGRDLFNLQWLQQHLQKLTKELKAQDVQATLTALTAQSCADAVLQFGSNCDRLLVCGGGVFNQELIRQLQLRLQHMRVESTKNYGMPALQVEAAAFAWLARRYMQGMSGNLPQATGAQGERILGALYPA